MDLITIIVPVYNVEKYLNRCLDSIAKQTYKNLEIILISDGSTDNSGKICDSYAMNDTRIRVLHKSNEGVSKARNLGLDNANGEYICFIDSDDYVESTYIEELYSLCKKNNADISICGTTDIKDGIKIKESNTIKEIWNPEQAIKELFDSNYFSCVMWAKIYKKEFLNEVRFNEETKIAEDLEIIYKIFDKANRIAIDTSKHLYYYEIRENSAIHSKFNENHEKEIQIIENAIIFLSEKYENIIQSVIIKYVDTNLMYLKKAIIDRCYNKDLYNNIRNNIKKYEKEIKKVKKIKIKLKKDLILHGNWILQLYVKYNKRKIQKL